ncbi:hypothetical protein [Nitratiruptor tergarcus]|uniref:DNA adenine methylase n=1 Tax=Nitratiruptor tergarcus DSM 16512 TaxID=1069081 RepID=A0A1W1WRM7_9BACT|nr:hypothetical protein [Nitratiruptor tergarcus]SMC08862.1 hypothetical protein SAMN05660197_0637 [Nitratiruptor tergarcus DSM 16512]
MEKIIDCLNYFSNIGTRNEVRARVIKKFMEEEPGTGSGKKASRYKYRVAKLQNGNEVILRRPANLKNGFDFLITVTNTNFNPSGQYRDYPKHDDVIEDLQRKKESNPELYNLFKEQIVKIFECKIEVENIDFGKFDFRVGYDVDLILHCLKWFFIEQDIRYWNYSGRDMLMGGIP